MFILIHNSWVQNEFVHRLAVFGRQGRLWWYGLEICVWNINDTEHIPVNIWRNKTLIYDIFYLHERKTCEKLMKKLAKNYKLWKIQKFKSV